MIYCRCLLDEKSNDTICTRFLAACSCSFHAVKMLSISFLYMSLGDKMIACLSSIISRAFKKS